MYISQKRESPVLVNIIQKPCNCFTVKLVSGSHCHLVFVLQTVCMRILLNAGGWLMGSFLFSGATVFTTRRLSAHASNRKQIADFLPGAWLTNTGSQFVSAARPFSLCCPGVQLALQLNLRDMFTGKRRVMCDKKNKIFRVQEVGREQTQSKPREEEL